MDSYLLLIFLHVGGAVVMFAAWGMEAATLSWLRQTPTVDEAREFLKRLRKQRPIAPIAMVVILATGIWMMAAQWGQQAWMIAAFAALVLIMGIGIVVSRRTMPQLHGWFAGKPKQLPVHFKSRIDSLTASLHMRISIGLGIIGLMTMKTALTGSLVIMALALSMGVTTVLYSLRRKK